MGQRLGIAAALLGDPPVLMFDEPVNGLDPDGVRWVRQLMRSLADEGRTVFVSSHLMSEMQLTADHLVVIGRGRLLADAPDRRGHRRQRGRRGARPQPAAGRPRRPRRAPHRRRGRASSRPAPNELTVTGATVERIGDLAYELGVRLHELSPHGASLEQAFMELTADSVEYAGTPTVSEAR